MIGFIIGTACLMGFIATWRAGRNCGRWAYHPAFAGAAEGGHCSRGYGYDSQEEHAGFGWRNKDRSKNLRWLFERLDTSPGQEKAIRNAVEELGKAAGETRGAWKGVSNDLGQVIAADHFDEVMLGETVAKLDGAQETLRKAVVKAMGDIHGALEPGQRQVLRTLLEKGELDILALAQGAR